VVLVGCAILDANLLPLSARRGLRDGMRGKIMRGRGWPIWIYALACIKTSPPGRQERL